MNKRKILSLAMALSIVAIMAVGATLAYFTDTDEATNVFAVGNVKIDLIEEEVGEDGILKPYETATKTLRPIVGSAQGAKDSNGVPTAANYIPKIVTVENEGTEDAYVRAYFAIPSALDDGPDTYNASKNILHFNFGTIADGTTTAEKQWIWKKDGQFRCFVYEMDGISYNVYYADYYQKLAPNAITERLLTGVYLDSKFDYDAENEYYTYDGAKIELDTAWSWNDVKLPVFAVAVQAEGFDNADAAVTAALGADYNPWAK